MENKKTPGLTVAASAQAPTLNDSITQKVGERYKICDIDNEQCMYLLPASLITDSFYRKMSSNAKLAYVLLRDRMRLSQKNKWADEETNDVFLYFKQEELQDTLNISHSTCNKVIKELINFGLIDVVRQGLQKPNKIYIRKLQNHTSRSMKMNSRSMKMKLPEVRKIDTGSIKSALPEVRKSDSNNTEYSNTKFSNTENNSKRAAANAADVSDFDKIHTSAAQKMTQELTLVVNAFQNNIHLISSEIEKDTLVNLVNTYSTQWVLEAIKEAAKSSGKTVKYIESILKRWSTLNSNQPWLIKKTQNQYNKQYNKAEATRQAAKDAVTELLEEFRREDEAQQQ